MRIRLSLFGALFATTGLVVSIAPRYSAAWWMVLLVHYSVAAGAVVTVAGWARKVDGRIQELESKLAAITEECRAELDETGREESVVVTLRV